MTGGFIGQLLRVNLTEKSIAAEPLRAEWLRLYAGGVGLATMYLYEEVPGGVDPLGPENKLVLMTGPLTGTPSASAGRYSVVAKSPLTGLWGHANSGGSFGPALKRSGFDGIILEGVSPEPVYLHISQGKAELRDASHLWGRAVPETEDRLQADATERLTIASIGPAGENQVRFAAIMNNKHRAAGRCGLGAVMGSKRLKAIACAGNARVPMANAEAFLTDARKQIDFLNESVLKVAFDTFGTNMVADMVNVRGGYPTRNWAEGTFSEIEQVNAQAMTDQILVEGVHCFSCPVSCGRGTEIREGKWKGRKGEGPEYESTVTLGALCGVSDLNAITVANYLCNENGLDTISTGSTIAFAIECYQKGILTPEQTGGLELRFGDADLVVDLVDRIARRDGVGDLLAEGTRRLAEQLGHGAEHFAINVKGLELPAYDPRAAKICGLGYVTANRGGDHITAYVEGPTFVDVPFLLVEDSHIQDPFVVNPSEAKVVVDMEDALTTLDCIGGCKFMGILLTAEDIIGLISNVTGWDYTVSEFRKTGERVYNLQRAFCVREGLSRRDDRLPERLMQDPLPDGPASGMVIDREMLGQLLDAYYDFRGWDRTTGIPSLAKLRELGLDAPAADLWKS